MNISLHHVAIWTNNLENLKKYYTNYFNASSNSLYYNDKTNFKSYFLTFKSGSLLEIMQKPDIPLNANDTIIKQHSGIIHLAFGVDTPDEVDKLAEQLQNDGFAILRGPRITGDGFYEFETADPDNNRIEVTCKLNTNKQVSEP